MKLNVKTMNKVAGKVLTSFTKLSVSNAPGYVNHIKNILANGK